MLHRPKLWAMEYHISPRSPSQYDDVAKQAFQLALAAPPPDAGQAHGDAALILIMQGTLAQPAWHSRRCKPRSRSGSWTHLRLPVRSPGHVLRAVAARLLVGILRAPLRQRVVLDGVLEAHEAGPHSAVAYGLG